MRERKTSGARLSLEHCLIYARRDIGKAHARALGLKRPIDFAKWLHDATDWDRGNWQLHAHVAEYLQQHPPTSKEITSARATISDGWLTMRSRFDLATHLRYAQWRAEQGDASVINNPVDYAWMNHRTARRDTAIARWLSGAEIPDGRRGRVSAGRSKHQLRLLELYALHLRQYGVSIPNIQMYARELKRSGEADDAVAMFLLSGDGARECPACKGDNFYFPEGEGKGARFCRHHRLIAS